MYEMADPANSFESYYALLGETAALLRNEKATRALQEKALLKQIEAFQKQAEENKQKEACEMQKQNQAIQKKEEAIREQTEAIQKQTEAFQKLSEAFQKQEESNRRQAEAIQQLEQAMQKQTKEIESLTSTAPAAASALPLIALEPNLATDIEDPRFIAGLPFKASYLKETAHALAAQVEVFSKDDKRLAVLSGTFIDREGRLVTCLHVADCEGVAEQVEYLMVTLPGGPEEKVRVEVRCSVIVLKHW